MFREQPYNHNVVLFTHTLGPMLLVMKSASLYTFLAYATRIWPIRRALFWFGFCLAERFSYVLQTRWLCRSRGHGSLRTHFIANNTLSCICLVSCDLGSSFRTKNLTDSPNTFGVTFCQALRILHVYSYGYIHIDLDPTRRRRSRSSGHDMTSHRCNGRVTGV